LRFLELAATIILSELVFVRQINCILVFLFLVLSTNFAYSADSKEKELAGTQNATHWLSLLDEGKYGDAWKQLAPSTEHKTNKEKWQSEVNRYRRQVGKLQGRILIGAEYTTKAPGGDEEGEYVVVTFFSSFERLGSALEIVVPQILPDGSWVISGYSIKPADQTD
jgi:hypothetical protein